MAKTRTATPLALPKIELEEKSLEVKFRLKGRAAIDLLAASACWNVLQQHQRPPRLIRYLEGRAPARTEFRDRVVCVHRSILRQSARRGVASIISAWPISILLQPAPSGLSFRIREQLTPGRLKDDGLHGQVEPPPLPEGSVSL